MTQQRVPRRPAMLEPAQAETIVGDVDPAAYSELAHASAWAVLGLADQDYPADAPQRVRALIAAEGIDAVAELWARSPEFTLPGALWRVFLFAEWLQRDRDLVEKRFRDGLAVYEATRGQVVGAESPDVFALTPHAVQYTIRQLFTGEHSEDTMELVFAQTAVVMRILATGDALTSEWITEPSDPLAYPVSTRAQALLRTAEELDKAAAYAHAGELD